MCIILCTHRPMGAVCPQIQACISRKSYDHNCRCYIRRYVIYNTKYNGNNTT